MKNKTGTEPLYDCPHCGRRNFTARGLKAHVCKGSRFASGGELPPLSNEERAAAEKRRGETLPHLPRQLPVVARSPAPPAAPAAGPDAGRDPWAAVRRYVEAATLFQRASLAAQIMAGLGLLELHKQYNPKGGRPKKLPHDVGVFSEPWPEAVKRHLGVSDQTAYRWMEMAKAARPRLTKGDIDLGRILEKHPSALTPAEQELLKTAVHKISDGHTQMEFLLSCGITKTPQGGGAKGGAREGAGRKTLTAEEAVAMRQESFECRIVALDEDLREKLWIVATDDQRKRYLGYLTDIASEVRASLRDNTNNPPALA
ncbi:MAG: hypothetical protein LBC18_03210 [Opitutaceae bacterium]|jgi:hypothetical protein|nr:hypothetical protein [Opitutaceae bacterium]